MSRTLEEFYTVRVQVCDMKDLDVSCPSPVVRLSSCLCLVPDERAPQAMCTVVTVELPEVMPVAKTLMWLPYVDETICNYGFIYFYRHSVLLR